MNEVLNNIDIGSNFFENYGMWILVIILILVIALIIYMSTCQKCKTDVLKFLHFGGFNTSSSQFEELKLEYDNYVTELTNEFNNRVQILNDRNDLSDDEYNRKFDKLLEEFEYYKQQALDEYNRRVEIIQSTPLPQQHQKLSASGKIAKGMSYTPWGRIFAVPMHKLRTGEDVDLYDSSGNYIGN